MSSRNSSIADINTLRTEMREDIAKLREEIFRNDAVFKETFNKHLNDIKEHYVIVADAANQVEKRTSVALEDAKRELKQEIKDGFSSLKSDVGEKFEHYGDVFSEFKQVHLELHAEDTRRLHWVIGITATLVAAIIVASATVLTHYNFLLSLLTIFVGSVITFWSKITLFFGMAIGSSALGQKLIRWHLKRKLKNDR